VRQLAAELTSFDVARSKDAGEPPGALARELKIPVESSLTAAWSDFLLKTSEGKARNVVAQLLLDHAEFVPSRLVDAFASLMLASLGIRRDVAQSPKPTPTEEPSRPSVLRREHRQQLQKALADAFSPGDLSQFVRARLDRNIEAISLGQSLSSTTVDLVKVADSEGWVFDLATQAFHAKPNKPQLAALAAELGLTGFAPQPTLERLVRNSDAFFDVASFQSRLDQVAAPICKVEVADRMMATGFLVGVDVLLTADAVVYDVRKGTVSPSALTIRFDYREGYGGELVRKRS
jgi:hypothetical protein